MIVNSANRKLINVLRKQALASIEQSRQDQHWISGINYLQDHYLYDLPIYRDMRVAADLADKIDINAKVLDWGCGYGSVSYFLQNKRPDLDIMLFDVLTSPPWENLIKHTTLEKVISKDQEKIPFLSNSFDVVIGVGVLEHVKNQYSSLREIHRILKPEGQLFNFLYPNVFSYTEKFQKLIGNPYHDKPSDIKKLSKMIDQAGFTNVRLQHQYMLPFVLSRFSPRIRSAYNVFGNIVVLANLIMEKIPFINNFSSNIMIVSKRGSI